MRKGRGKSKKPTVVSSREDLGSGEDEKIPESKRRGRPQKQSKDDIDEDDVEKKEEEDVKGSVSIKEMKCQAVTENGRKRKGSMQAKESIDSVKKEICTTTKSSMDDSSKSVGYRQNGSRRKNKPRRAAEAVVECK